MIKAILYDMDGTVLDTMPIYEHSWRAADEAFGCNGKAVALLPTIAGMKDEDIRALALSRLGEDFPYADFRRILSETFEKVIAQNGIPCKKGAPEVFDHIRAMGIRQVLVTSSAPPRVFPYLELAGIRDVFDDIITGDMVTHSKPNPEIFLMGAEKAGCLPSECVVVEDAANGARAGIAAEMRTVMIPEYPPVPQDIATKLWHECRDLTELPALIAAANQQ